MQCAPRSAGWTPGLPRGSPGLGCRRHRCRSHCCTWPDRSGQLEMTCSGWLCISNDAAWTVEKGMIGKRRGTHCSHLMGAFRDWNTSITASLISGPMPSPGISVTVWGLASPGEGTYVILWRACTGEQMPYCQKMIKNCASFLQPIHTSHIRLHDCSASRVGTPTCCNCCHWGESPSKRLAERSIVAAPGPPATMVTSRRAPARQSMGNSCGLGASETGRAPRSSKR